LFSQRKQQKPKERKKEKDVENLILSYNSQLQAQQQKK